MKRSNQIYIYDNTFINLLTLVTFLINKHIIPFNLKNEDYIPTLVDEVINLKLDNKDELIEQLTNKLGIDIFNIIYYVFLSNNENKELIIYYFILSSLKYKKNVIYMRNLKYVNKALNIAHYVKREAHRMKGFVRFKELNNNILYAEFAPENNIIFLIAKHFKNVIMNRSRVTQGSIVPWVFAR